MQLFLGLCGSLLPDAVSAENRVVDASGDKDGDSSNSDNDDEEPSDEEESEVKPVPEGGLLVSNQWKDIDISDKSKAIEMLLEDGEDNDAGVVTADQKATQAELAKATQVATLTKQLKYLDLIRVFLEEAGRAVLKTSSSSSKAFPQYLLDIYCHLVDALVVAGKMAHGDWKKAGKGGPIKGQMATLRGEYVTKLASVVQGSARRAVIRAAGEETAVKFCTHIEELCAKQNKALPPVFQACAGLVCHAPRGSNTAATFEGLCRKTLNSWVLKKDDTKWRKTFLERAVQEDSKDSGSVLLGKDGKEAEKVVGDALKNARKPQVIKDVLEFLFRKNNASSNILPFHTMIAAAVEGCCVKADLSKGAKIELLCLAARMAERLILNSSSSSSSSPAPRPMDKSLEDKVKEIETANQGSKLSKVAHQVTCLFQKLRGNSSNTSVSTVVSPAVPAVATSPTTTPTTAAATMTSKMGASFATKEDKEGTAKASKKRNSSEAKTTMDSSEGGGLQEGPSAKKKKKHAKKQC